MSLNDQVSKTNLEDILHDPTSNGHVENILDVITALIWDCNFASAKNSRAIQSFTQRFSEVADAISVQRTKYSDFELVKVIGQGGFGRVELVRHKNTRRVYAMKMMSKQHLLDHSQSGYWEERDIMVKAASEWLVACDQAFLDKENIYLCMEYMPGGDLYHWLEQYDTFTEDQARFYLAETVLALEALHGLGYIHRDLKPDNMLLDMKGHLKLADFGSCVRVDANGRHFCTSPIGTPDYISPEMLNCQSKAGNVGPECDWWALGVIAFEMLFGETAFYGQSLVETYSRILSHERSLKIPSDTEISPEFEKLIRDFLKPASIRLGAVAQSPELLGGANAVKQHIFFSGIDWSSLHHKTPPIEPSVTSEVDTSNINFDESELISDKFGNINRDFDVPSNKLPRSGGALAPKKSPSSTYFTGENLAFAGFTYSRDSNYSKKRVANGSDDIMSQEKILASLSEVKFSLQAAIRQNAIDQVTIKETQQRLGVSLSELALATTAREDLEHQNELIRSRLENVEKERDSLIERIGKLKQEFAVAVSNLESERRATTSTLDEISKLKVLKSDLDAKICIMSAELKGNRISLPFIPGNLVIDEKQRDCTPEHSLKSISSDGRMSLQEDIGDSHNQISLRNSQLASVRRQHAEEIADLSDQLQVSKYFADLYKSQLSESEELYSISRKNEESFFREVEILKTTVENLSAERAQLREKIFQLESALAVANVELSEQKKNLESELKEASDQVARYRQLATNRSFELEGITNQRAQLLEHCKSLEANISAATEQHQLLRKENSSQKIKLDLAVGKLAEVAAKNPAVTGKKKRSNEAVKVSLLEKQLRNAEYNHNIEIIGLKATIANLKAENSEKAEALDELIHTKENLSLELSKASSQIYELYDMLDQKPEIRRPLINTATGGGDFSANSSPTTTLLDMSSISASLESLQSRNLDTLSRMLPMTHIEGICDFPVKGRGRHKLAWVPKYIVISQLTIAFFASREQHEQVGSIPTDEIQLRKIFSVRAGTVLDLNYATADDASRLICIVSDEISGPADTHEMFDTSTSSGFFNSSSTGTCTPVQGGSYIHTVPENISWRGHSFQPMTFRIMNTMCEFCRRPCSDLISPPPALECMLCRMRIHRLHVEQHEKFIVCPKTVKQWLIRAPDSKIRREWISKISQLRQEVVDMRKLSDGFMTPGPTFNHSRRFGTLLSSSTHYSSMRNFPTSLNSDVRNAQYRRSVLGPNTFPPSSCGQPINHPPSTKFGPRDPQDV